MMHIIPAVITKPISNGVNRVWGWVCSKMEEKREPQIISKTGSLVQPSILNGPTSHLSAYAGYTWLPVTLAIQRNQTEALRRWTEKVSVLHNFILCFNEKKIWMDFPLQKPALDNTKLPL